MRKERLRGNSRNAGCWWLGAGVESARQKLDLAVSRKQEWREETKVQNAKR